MSISYYGHSNYPIGRTNELLAQLRRERTGLTWQALSLANAAPLSGPFDRDIARDFGIEALCRFQLSIIDKEQAHLVLQGVLDGLYRAFGSEHLVLTWELDSIVPPPSGC